MPTFKVQVLNNISEKGLSHLTQDYVVGEKVDEPDAILVRSANMHDLELPRSVKFVGRAGAGVNNIPVDELSEKGIVVCNTPGANANAVKELVIAGLLLSSRKLIDGIKWVETQKDNQDVGKTVEKQKKAYAGPELKGKKIGVIGLGAIGVLVANTCVDLGMEVYGFDPYISIENAWGLSRGVHRANSLEDILEKSDYITIHIPYMKETENYINKDNLKNVKEGIRILNFARGGLIEEEAIIEALKDGRVSSYITDFPSQNLIGVENAVLIPHLGASTPESEENCAEMVVEEMMDYLQRGNIKNSVNYPEMDMGEITNNGRISIGHHNKPNMIAQITAILAKDNINISDLKNTNSGNYAYTVIDTDSPVSEKVKEDLYKIDGVTRVRILK